MNLATQVNKSRFVLLYTMIIYNMINDYYNVL